MILEYQAHFFNVNSVFFLLIAVELIYNVVLVSSIQQSDSVIHMSIYLYILFQIIFCYRLLQDTEFSSVCYTGDLCCLPVFIYSSV